MRLTYMYYLMRDNYMALEKLILQDQYETIGSTRQPYGFVDNWQNAKEALLKIKEIPSFSNLCNNILKAFQQGDNSFKIPITLYREIEPKYSGLLKDIRSVTLFCQDLGLMKTL